MTLILHVLCLMWGLCLPNNNLHAAIPQRVIMDAGTENVVVKDIQEAFSCVYDNPVNESVTVTSSPRNQVFIHYIFYICMYILDLYFT